MTQITCIENHLSDDYTHFSCFVIEPVELGQGITIGNAIRRVLLSELTGFAVTGARMNNLTHEFQGIDGFKEETLDLLLNLKEIKFKEDFFSFFSKEDVPASKTKYTGFLHVQGPKIVTAGMFQLDSEHLEIINPEQYIGTLMKDTAFYCEIDIEEGKKYQFADWKLEDATIENLEPFKARTLAIDANFNPVINVNYKIKLIHDSLGHIRESLIFEITTNLSTSPYRCLLESIKILLHLFLPLLAHPINGLLSQEFLDIFYNLDNQDDENDLSEKPQS
jgi:DNA-directed RNA polymerase subunit alpha